MKDQNKQKKHGCVSQEIFKSKGKSIFIFSENYKKYKALTYSKCNTTLMTILRLHPVSQSKHLGLTDEHVIIALRIRQIL